MKLLVTALVDPISKLMNGFFLKDLCALFDQMSFFSTSSWRRFVLAKRDRHRANKNEIAIFVFSVTAKDFPHGVLLHGNRRNRHLKLTAARQYSNPTDRPSIIELLGFSVGFSRSLDQ